MYRVRELLHIFGVTFVLEYFYLELSFIPASQTNYLSPVNVEIIIGKLSPRHLPDWILILIVFRDLQPEILHQHFHDIVNKGVDVKVSLLVLFRRLEIAYDELPSAVILLGVGGHVAGGDDLEGGAHHDAQVGQDRVGVREGEVAVGQLVLPVQHEVLQFACRGETLVRGDTTDQNSQLSTSTIPPVRPGGHAVPANIFQPYSGGRGVSDKHLLAWQEVS